MLAAKPFLANLIVHSLLGTGNLYCSSALKIGDTDETKGRKGPLFQHA